MKDSINYIFKIVGICVCTVLAAILGLCVISSIGGIIVGFASTGVGAVILAIIAWRLWKSYTKEV